MSNQEKIESISVKTIANFFIDLAAKDKDKEIKQLTNMQLQKLVYIAHGYCLGFLNRPLYYEQTLAWHFGPVTPVLYEPLQKYGNGLVTEHINHGNDSAALKDGSKEKEIIEAVWYGYKHFSGERLSALTHEDNTPWSKTWKNEHFSVIENDIIEKYYKEKIDKNKNAH